MTIKESISFNYDGVDSTTMGISNVSVSSGLYEEPFLAEREIIEKPIRGRETPYFIEKKRKPLVFDLSFAFDSAWDETKIRDVARWLDQPYYKPFYTNDKPNKIYYAMLDSDSQILHNGLNEGYVQIRFRCNAPYAFSPVYVTQTYKTSTQDVAETGTTETNITMTAHGLQTGDYIVNTTRGNAIRQVTVVDANNVTVASVTGQTSGDVIDKYTGVTINITLNNTGDLEIMPELEIWKVGDGNVSIINTSNNNEELAFTGLSSDEIVYVNNDRQEITSDIPGTYRYSAHNGTFLKLIRNTNNLQLTGNFTVYFRYQEKFLQG